MVQYKSSGMAMFGMWLYLHYIMDCTLSLSDRVMLAAKLLQTTTITSVGILRDDSTVCTAYTATFLATTYVLVYCRIQQLRRIYVNGLRLFYFWLWLYCCEKYKIYKIGNIKFSLNLKIFKAELNRRTPRGWCASCAFVGEFSEKTW